MSTLKKYHFNGKEAGSLTVDKSFLDVSASKQMVKDYIVALRANARQWSANTKGRSEVSHSNKKPHRQKGTGNARQGSLASPQYKGGGIVFGPKPKHEQHVTINRKERRLAIRSLITDMIEDGNVHVVEDAAFTEGFETPKTKKVDEFLKGLQLKGKRVLFVGEGNYQEVEVEGKKQRINVHSGKHTNFMRSMRNIPKAKFAYAAALNGYDVMLAADMIMTESAWKELQTVLT